MLFLRLTPLYIKNHILNLNIRKDRGDQKNLPKFQKRTERYKKDYVMIKTVDRDDISKFALSNTRNLNKMVSDVRCDEKIDLFFNRSHHHLKKESKLG